MRKTILLFTFIFSLTAAYAQKASFGVEAGLNVTKASMSFYGTKRSNNYEPNFHLGALVDIDFGAFSIQPGLIYTTKGGITKPDYFKVTSAMQTPAIGRSRLVIGYFEAPVNFLYKIKKRSGYLFVGGGPYFALATGANTSYKGDYMGETETTSYVETIGNGPTDKAKRWDIGLNIKAGYHYKSGYTLSAGFGSSLTNIGNSGTSKNRVFSLSVGRFF